MLLSGLKSSVQRIIWTSRLQRLEEEWRVSILVAWGPVWSFHSLWWFAEPFHLLVLVHCALSRPKSVLLSFPLLASFMKTLILFSSRAWHLPTVKKVPQWPCYNRGWWVNKLPDLNSSDNLLRGMMGTRATNADKPKIAIKATWLFSTSEDSYNLHAASLQRCIHSSKRSPDQVLSGYTVWTHFPEGWHVFINVQIFTEDLTLINMWTEFMFSSCAGQSALH